MVERGSVYKAVNPDPSSRLVAILEVPGEMTAADYHLPQVLESQCVKGNIK